VTCSAVLFTSTGELHERIYAPHTVRVRLNRSGDRQLNQTLHVVVLTRLRYDPATRADAQRRWAEGKTNREIRRCLVRYIARQLYRLLEAQPPL
jgi:transposase